MRHGQLALLALLTFSTTAWAQAQVVSPESVLAPSPTVLAVLSADDVVARMLSFDRNNNGRVEKAELAERMHGLVARGDVDGDGALDGTEVRALANTPPPGAAARRLQFSNSYGFADTTSFSSRNHIDDSLDDLRLAGPTKQRAAEVAKAYVDTLEAAALADLLKETEGLLTVGQFSNFKDSLDSQRRTAQALTFNPSGDAARARMLVMLRGVDPRQRLESYGLAPAEKAKAIAAVEQYKTRLRLGDAGRSGLLAQLEDILSVEERNNFRAALERRPVVATSPNLAFSTVLNEIRTDVNNAVRSKVVGRVVVQGGTPLDVVD